MAWETLLDILAQNAEFVAQERSEQPADCPRCGEPLEEGPNGVLHCSFDGWTN